MIMNIANISSNLDQPFYRGKERKKNRARLTPDQIDGRSELAMAISKISGGPVQDAEDKEPKKIDYTQMSDTYEKVHNDTHFNDVPLGVNFSLIA